MILWWTERRGLGWYRNLQKLWLSTLACALGLSASVALADPALGRVLVFYTPWVSLAGLSLTLAVEAAIQVASRGIVVKPDYFPDARIQPPDPVDTASYSLVVVPVVLLAYALCRAGIAFYYREQ